MKVPKCPRNFNSKWLQLNLTMYIWCPCCFDCGTCSMKPYKTIWNRATNVIPTCFSGSLKADKSHRSIFCAARCLNLQDLQAGVGRSTVCTMDTTESVDNLTPYMFLLRIMFNAFHIFLNYFKHEVSVCRQCRWDHGALQAWIRGGASSFGHFRTSSLVFFEFCLMGYNVLLCWQCHWLPLKHSWIACPPLSLLLLLVVVVVLVSYPVF